MELSSFSPNPHTLKLPHTAGQILADMGLLSKGEVHFKTASDFKGDVLGASEQKTRDILRASEGGVLVIDEAYALWSAGMAPCLGHVLLSIFRSAARQYTALSNSSQAG